MAKEHVEKCSAWEMKIKITMTHDFTSRMAKVFFNLKRLTTPNNRM